MNIIWCLMVVAALLFGALNGCIEETLTAGLNGATEAVKTVMMFGGIMCFWCGILEVAIKSGLVDIVKKILMPILHLLFPKLGKSSDAINYIALNLTANLIGSGNGATPMGIAAVNSMKDEHNSDITKEMCVFAVLNIASVQIMPTGIMALRTSAGSENPFFVLKYIWLCSGLSLIVGLTAVNILYLYINSRRKND